MGRSMQVNRALEEKTVHPIAWLLLWRPGMRGKWQGDKEGGTLVFDRLEPDMPAVSFNVFAA
jgi:hypothetical protein